MSAHSRPIEATEIRKYGNTGTLQGAGAEIRKYGNTSGLRKPEIRTSGNTKNTARSRAKAYLTRGVRQRAGEDLGLTDGCCQRR